MRWSRTAVVALAAVLVFGHVAQAAQSGLWLAYRTLQLELYDPLDTTTLLAGPLTITAAGITEDGLLGLATDPTSGLHYAILKEGGIRHLCTLDLDTGVASVVASLGNAQFSSITFRADGQLLGVTGDGGNPPETLFFIDKATGTQTLATALGNGADGEVICYCPADNMIYHWSGNGVFEFEKVESAAPWTVTPISTDSTHSETFGCVWDAANDQFLVGNIREQVYSVKRDGTTGPYLFASGRLDDVRGMAIVGSGTEGDPHFTGMLGQRFDLDGEPGQHYNWYSDVDASIVIRIGLNPDNKKHYVNQVAARFGEDVLFAFQPQPDYLLGWEPYDKNGTMGDCGYVTWLSDQQFELRWHTYTLRVQTRRPLDGSEHVHHLNLQLTAPARSPDTVHGLLGQTHRLTARSAAPGAKNGEGLIEGTLADYAVSGKWATDSKFNRFERAVGALSPAQCRQMLAERNSGAAEADAHEFTAGTEGET